jgi:hypothetical protein
MYSMLVVYCLSFVSLVFFYDKIGYLFGIVGRASLLIIIIMALVWQIYHIIFRLTHKRIKDENISPENL